MTARIIVFAVLWLVGWANVTLAQRTFAVIVGVSDYYVGQPGKGDLQFSDDDARSFYALLRSPAGGSVPEENIRVLIDKNATRNSVLLALTIFRQATRSDRVIFYFSGHGERGMFLPYDYGTSRNATLWHDDIKAAFLRSQAGTKFLLADACMAGTMKPRNSQPHPVVAANSPLHDPTSNVVVMLSSQDKEYSRETAQLKQGAFTFFLVRGAKGAADQDNDGIVSIKEIAVYVNKNLLAITRNQQKPRVIGRFDENMPFTVVRY
jgi:Caspase domain